LSSASGWSSTEVRGVDAAAGGVVVRGLQNGSERRFEADLAVHGAGRVPDIDDLDLDVAGVQREQGGVVVNQFLQSVSNPPSTPAAMRRQRPAAHPEGRSRRLVLTANLLKGNHRSPKLRGHCLGRLHRAAAGVERAQRRRRPHPGPEISHETTRRRRAGSTRAAWETVSGFKVLVEEETGRVLGAHLLGPHADEVINLFAVAIRLGLRADALKETLYAYPTYGSDIRSWCRTA